MRVKALAEIYTMHSFAQLCNLNILSKNVILEQCKGVQSVDLGENFQTHICL